MSEDGLVVVIPTRNRADLAISALKSVLSQSAPAIQVFISDNSTNNDFRSHLREFCDGARDKRVRYLTPPEPLPMAKHWDWVLQQALSLSEADHFSFLTDRMLFKPNAIEELIGVITAYPDKILTYMHDIVDDFTVPAVVRQYTWTGNLYEVPTTRLLEMSAQSIMYDSCLPRMLNCIVPRDILRAIQERFGSIFSPIAPDWNFCYRALEMEQSILFHDKAALVHHAQDRSNGQSAHYGITNESYRSFIRDLGALPLNFAAPFPEIITVWNAIVSEYCHTKQATQSPKFPEVNLDNYKRALALGVAAIRDPQRRAQMEVLLSARGWKAPESVEPSSPAPPAATEEIASGIDSFSANSLEFQDAAEALDYALHQPRPKSGGSTHETLIQGVRKPLPRELFGRYASLIPPLDLMHDGPAGYQEFKDSGEEFFGYYTGLCRLKPDEKMLDVGSGVGRKTFLLTDYIHEPGRYEGIDVVKAGIDWCTERITRTNPCFRFQLVDVYNRYYNPAGRFKAADYKFPFARDSFDLVVLASVFTHMLPEDVENYLAEVSRVLQPGGRCLISFFLLNPESRKLIESGRSSIPMSLLSGPCWTHNPDAPETATGYEEAFVVSLCAKYSLEIALPIQYGSWCGRSEFLSYQDLVLAFKRPR